LEAVIGCCAFEVLGFGAVKRDGFEIATSTRMQRRQQRVHNWLERFQLAELTEGTFERRERSSAADTLLVQSAQTASALNARRTRDAGAQTEPRQVSACRLEGGNAEERHYLGKVGR